VPVDVDEWREEMSHQNQERVDAMTDEEREEERREIIARFGDRVGDLLKRVKQARSREAEKGNEALAQDSGQVPGALSGSLEEGSGASFVHSNKSVTDGCVYQFPLHLMMTLIIRHSLTDVSRGLLYL
jgi:hypothetical protein